MNKTTGEAGHLKNLTIFERWFYHIKHWLYRGQKPNMIAKMINHTQARAASKRVTANGLITLEVTGRKSGKIISFPLVMVTVDGQRYLAAMLGENVQWVRNVKAAKRADRFLKTYLVLFLRKVVRSQLLL